MGVEFVAKNGLIAQNNSTISGSLTVTQGVTASLQGTASWANNFASATNYVLNSATSSMLSPYVLTSVTSSMLSPYATTGSNTLNGTQTITGSGQLLVKSSTASGYLQQTTDFANTSTGTNVFIGLAASIGNTYANLSTRTAGGVGNGNLSMLSAGGNVAIGKTTFNAVLDVNGNTIITGSLNVTAGITGTLSGTATTASSVSTLSQNVLITGSLTVGSASIGPNENTITLGARDTGGEGGQIGFSAPGGTYTSASFLDNYQNRFRILKGNNTTSQGDVASFSLVTNQLTLPSYTGPTSFAGTVAAVLGVNSSGDVITAPGWVDYSGTSTIIGFTTYVAGGKNIQYQIVGKTMYVQFDLRSATNAGSGTTTSFTIPNNASAWAGTQVGMCRTQNTTTQNVGMYQIAAGSNQMVFYLSSNNSTSTTWTDAGTRHIQGFAVISIA